MLLSLEDDINYLDLFHGIGGFAYGAYLAGMKFDNHLCSDIEPYCQKLYKLRFPDSIQLGDITKIDTQELIKKYGMEWIITGGFPCQDISIAGKGAGITGSRSGLWSEYWRIIRDLRPRFAIMENVAALTFRGLDAVLGSLSEIGYNAEWQMLQACQFGLPHRRDRMWIVAYSQSIYDLWSNKKKNRREMGWSKKLGRCSRGLPKPKIMRTDDGIPEQLDESKGLGNSIVPQIAKLLFEQIKELI
jgi:DNA (cytosine-5)-methyltransferase 1